jgi:hypothetical protein
MLAQKKAEEEVEEVQSMLRRLQMGRLEEDRKREEAFQMRRKGLWDVSAASFLRFRNG